LVFAFGEAFRSVDEQDVLLAILVFGGSEDEEACGNGGSVEEVWSESNDCVE